MTQIRITDQEVRDCLEHLWRDALVKDAFGTVCTLLRVTGLQDAGWDPLEESEEAFQDYNWHLKAEADDLSEKSQWRIGLLMYCQAIEMYAVHSMLANLLRILLDQPYHIDPLGSLGRVSQKAHVQVVPTKRQGKVEENHRNGGRSGASRSSAADRRRLRRCCPERVLTF